MKNSSDILLNRKATRAAIYNAPRKLAAIAASSDNVLIYYAGHGRVKGAYLKI